MECVMVECEGGCVRVGCVKVECVRVGCVKVECVRVGHVKVGVSIKCMRM